MRFSPRFPPIKVVAVILTLAMMCGIGAVPALATAPTPPPPEPFHIETISNQTKHVGESLTISLQANKSADFSVTGLPSGLSLVEPSPGHGHRISGTITAAPGTYVIQVTAAHAPDETASTSFVLTVEQPNVAPVFDPDAGAQTISEGGSLAPVSASDGNGDALTYTVSSGSLPDGVSLSSSGSFSGAATHAAVADAHVAVIKATDPDGLFDTYQLTVTVADVTAPYFEGAPYAWTVGELQPLGDISAEDDDSDVLTYSIVSGDLPSSVTMGDDGSFSGVPANGAVGTYTLTVRAFDGYNAATATLTIKVVDLTAPAFTGGLDQDINEGGSLASLTATDADGDALTFHLVSGSGSLPSGVSLNSDGSFSGTAGPHSAGRYTVDVEVSDGYNDTVGTLTIDVTDITPPHYDDACQTFVINEGDWINVSLAASDDDGDQLDYSLDGSLPSGIRFYDEGLVQGVADMDASGEYCATITASDGSKHAHAYITLVVLDDTTPCFTSDSTNARQRIHVGDGLEALQAFDDDGDELEFFLMSGSLPPGITLNWDGTFDGEAAESSHKNYEAVIGVSDGALHEWGEVGLVAVLPPEDGEDDYVGITTLHVDVIADSQVPSGSVTPSAPPEEPAEPPVTPPVVDTSFTDIAGHWAEHEIIRMAGRSAIAGYADHTFRPNAAITREAFAKALMVTLNIAPDAEPLLPFTDKGLVSDWAAGYVAAAARTGIMPGVSFDRFAPTDPISRYDAVACLIRGLRYIGLSVDEPDGTSLRDDSSFPSVNRDSITAAFGGHFVLGYEDQYFHGERNLTRAEACALFDRIWGLITR